MKRERFEQLVHEAITDLPEEFRSRLENVVIIVEEHHPDEDLFGLYEGTPLTERGSEPPLFPDRIYIYQEPIEEESENDAEIRREVQLTIMHEIAHFFGIEDDVLEDLGY